MGRRPSASREKYVKYWLHFIITWETVVLATLSTLVPPSLTTLFSAFSHPPRSYRGVSSFSFSLSLVHFPFLSFSIIPWFPRSCPFATLSLSPPHTLTRGLRFLSHRTAGIRVCACMCSTLGMHARMCLYLDEQEDSRSRFRISYAELRSSTIWFHIKNYSFQCRLFVRVKIFGIVYYGRLDFNDFFAIQNFSCILRATV